MHHFKLLRRASMCFFIFIISSFVFAIRMEKEKHVFDLIHRDDLVLLDNLPIQLIHQWTRDWFSRRISFINQEKGSDGWGEISELKQIKLFLTGIWSQKSKNLLGVCENVKLGKGCIETQCTMGNVKLEKIQCLGSWTTSLVGHQINVNFKKTLRISNVWGAGPLLLQINQC